MESRRQIIVAFTSLLAHLSIFHFIAVEVGGFFQHAITGHVPLKTRYDKHTHTLTLHSFLSRDMDFTGVFMYLLYLLYNDGSTYLTMSYSYIERELVSFD